MRERASERTNERSGKRERSEQCGESERVSGASERVKGGANGPVLYASISYHLKPLCDAPMQEVKSSLLRVQLSKIYDEVCTSSSVFPVSRFLAL